MNLDDRRFLGDLAVRLRQRRLARRWTQATPAGREELQELASRYYAASGRLKPAGTSAITYILVYEREQGVIS